MAKNIQLAAILFSDIVGYTALMEKDESSALDTVRKSREIQKPLVEKHNGIWLKEMGDGVMSQFRSAMDAVNCAIEIQEAAGNELPAKLRIGIHLGDITFENEEIYGDGVNIASRIESIAEPGSIYVSEAVSSAVKGRGGIHTLFQGEKRLKNVEDPVRIYKIIPGESIESIPRRTRRQYLVPAVFILVLVLIGLWQLGGPFFNKNQKIILVLPFELVNPDSSQQIIAARTWGNLNSSIGNIKSLRVFGWNTSYAFEASLNPISDARNKLDSMDYNVDYFVRGSIETMENRITLNMRLYDKKKNEIWQKQYNDYLIKLPSIISNITTDISKSINIKLNTGEIQVISELKPFDPEIYRFWDKGWNEIYKWNPEAYIRARVYLNEAVEKMPADARTWAELAKGLVTIGHSGIYTPGIWEDAKSASLRALQLDSLNALAWSTLAESKSYGEMDYAGAEYAFKKSNSLNPSDAMNHYHYAWLLLLFDRMDEAIIEQTKAQELDPLMVGHTADLAVLYWHKGDFENAMKEARRALRIVNNFPHAYDIIGQLYLDKKQYDSALYYYEKLPRNTIQLCKFYFNKGEIEKGMVELNKLKSYPLNGILAFWLARIYSKIDSLDQFFYYANYEPAAFDAPYLRVFIDNPKVIKDPRFRKLMDKWKLPMPKGYE